MDKERFLESGLLEQYVLGLTTEEENEEVERYARAFPEVKAEIDLLRSAIRQYAEEQIATPKLNRVVAHDGRPPLPRANRPRSSSVGRGILIGCLLLLGVFGIYQYLEAERTKDQLAELNETHLSFQAECQEDRQMLSELQRQVEFYEHNFTTPLQLTGTELAPESNVRVFWNEQIPLAIAQVVSLPEISQNKHHYHLWAKINDEMVSLGPIDPQSHEPQKIKCLPEASSLNITLEPDGDNEEAHVDQLYANVSLQ